MTVYTEGKTDDFSWLVSGNNDYWFWHMEFTDSIVTMNGGPYKNPAEASADLHTMTNKFMQRFVGSEVAKSCGD